MSPKKFEATMTSRDLRPALTTRAQSASINTFSTLYRGVVGGHLLHDLVPERHPVWMIPFDLVADTRRPCRLLVRGGRPGRRDPLDPRAG